MTDSIAAEKPTQPVPHAHRDLSHVREQVDDLMPAVRNIARHAARGLAGTVEVDDLIGAGQLGLAQALAKFRPEDSGWFRGYALTRIRGAVYDELRKLDELPRGRRVDASRFDDTVARLTSQLGRTPDDHEVAGDLGLSEDDYVRRRNGSRRRPRVPVDGLGDRSGTVEVVLADVDSPGVEAAIDAARSLAQVRIAMERLPTRHLRVLEAYSFEGLTLREIGGELGVSEARACQIRREAIAMLEREIGGAPGPHRHPGAHRATAGKPLARRDSRAPRRPSVRAPRR